MEKLIRALRCSVNAPSNGFECTEDCPYRKLNEMGQDILTCCPPDVIIDGIDYYISCDYDRMKLDAADALEKQIPKKPIMRKDVAETYYICSECEMEVDRFDDNYCSDCGHKLDWSSEE